MFSGLPFVIERTYVFDKWGTFFYDWGPFFSGPNFIGDSNFFILPQLLFYTIIPNVVLSYKLLDILIFFVMFSTMYLLAYTVSRKKRVLSGIVAAVFYSLTPYMLLEIIGHQSLMFSYAFLPSAYLSIHEGLVGSTKRKYLWVSLAGLSIAASTAFGSLEYVYVNGIFLVLFSIALCFKGISRTSIKPLFGRLISVVIMFSIPLLLSAYFILPMVFSNSPFLTVSTFTRMAQVPRYSNTFVEASFLLDKSLPVDIGLTYFSVYGLLMIPFVLPLILSCLLLVSKRRKADLLYLLFFLLGALALLFSMGSNLPSFLNVFQYAGHLPLFEMIRTPCRFTIQVALSFSVLGGIAVGSVSDSLGNLTRDGLRALRRNYKALLAVLVIAIVPSSYVFSGVTIAYSVAGPYQSQPIPESASKVVAWLNQQDPNQEYRIIDFTQSHIISSHHRSLVTGSDLISKYWCSPSLAQMLGLLNVKYIITDNDSYINPKLSSLPNFNLVPIDEDLVYVDTLPQGELYCTYGAMVIGGPNALSTFYAATDGTVASTETFEESSLNLPSANWALFSPDLLAKQSSINQFQGYNAVVFADSDLQDLVFQQIDSSYKFEPSKYLNADWRIVDDSSGDPSLSAQSYQNSVDGQLVISQRAIYTESNATLQVPINISSTDSYDVWIRASNALPSETSNVISASIDGSKVGQADFGNVGGFKWLQANTASTSLSKGSHMLSLYTNGNPVYLDMVSVAPTGILDLAVNQEIASLANVPQMYVLEFSNYFVGANVTKQNDVLPFASYSSSGYLTPEPSSSGYLTLQPDSAVTQQLYVAKADRYALDLRFLDRPDGGNLTIKIDGKPLSSIQASGSYGWCWTHATYIYLNAGEHEIQLTSKSGENSIDIMSLVDSSLVATLAVQPGSTQYAQVHLSEWQGTLNFTRPAFAAFAESYYPEWVFQTQTNQSATSLPSSESFYLLNTYHIDSVGVSEFSVFHVTSQLRYIAFAIAISTFVACMIVIIIVLLRYRAHQIAAKLNGNQSEVPRANLASAT